MKIGIDTFGCGHGKSGIGTYLLSLVANLQNTDELTFELFGSEQDRYTYSSDSNFKYRGIKLKDKFEKEVSWHKYWFNDFTRRRKYDAVLVPAAALMFPSKFKTKVIAVVNSIISESVTVDSGLRGKTPVLIKNLSKAHRIIAASSHIKKDLEKLGIDGSKIAIVFNGINHSLFYPRDMVVQSTVEIKPFSIRRPYFVYASSMVSDSKKHIELISAFTRFKQKTGLPHRLVLAGSEGESTPSVKLAARSSLAARDIFITGFYPHDSFPELYSYSEGCVFPSVNEGVGLPVLEAMATGIPVFCSKMGALGEVAGNNALFFDSDNIDDIADCFEKIATDKELRKKLVEDGKQWAKRFSWEKTAQKTSEVILELLQSQKKRK